MALGEHHCVDPLHDNGIAAGDVLEIDRVAIDTEQARQGNKLDAQLVHVAQPQIAHVAGDGFASHVPRRRQAHAAPVAGEFFGQSEADPVATPVGNCHVRANIPTALKNLPGVQDMRLVGALHLGPANGRACGDDHAVRCFAFDRAAVDIDPQFDTDTRELHFALKVGDDAAELGPARQKLRQQGLPAESV